jgi:O-antigen ligase
MLILILSFLSLSGFSLLLYKNYQLALSLFPALLPSYLIRLSIFGLPSTLLELLIVTLILFAIALHRDQLFSIKKLSPIDILALAALVIGIISTLVAPNIFSALGIYRAYILQPIIIFFIYRQTYQTNNWLDLAKFLGLTASLISFFAIYQLAFNFALPIPWDIDLRATSIFPYPNALGLFLAPVFFLNLFAYLESKKLLYSAYAFLSIVGIFLAETEAGIGAIIVTIAVMAMVFHQKNIVKTLTFIASLALATLLLIIPFTRQKILFTETSGQVRLSQWSETIDLLKDRPFFGSGLSGYPEIFANYHRDLQFEIFQYPHNIFLNFWTEFGLFGLFWLILLVIFILTKFSFKSNLQLALFAIFCSTFIHGLVDVPYFKNDLAVFIWVLVAIFLADSHLQQGQKQH